MSGREFFEAPDIASAIALAEDLKAKGRYDCFRGQINANWPVRSSLARVDAKAREEAAQRFARFNNWIRASRDVLPYIHDDDQILAIAQHYGLRTPLLDLTTEPKIAGFFAVHGRKDERYGCIYMIERSDFSRVCEPFKEHLRIFDIEVANLWRLQAQRGLFLEARWPIEQIYPFDRIVFPHSDAPLPIKEYLMLISTEN